MTTHAAGYVEQLASELLDVPDIETPLLLIHPALMVTLIQRLADVTQQRDAARHTVTAEQAACNCRRTPHPGRPKPAGPRITDLGGI